MPTQHLRLSLPAPSPLGPSWHAYAIYPQRGNAPISVRVTYRLPFIPFPLLVRTAKWLPIAGAWSHRAWTPKLRSPEAALLDLVAARLRRR